MPEPAPPQPERELLKWLAPSRPFRARNRQFFATVIVIVVLVSVILVLAGEWMLIATLAALVFAYHVWSTVPPEEVEHLITTRGLWVHGRLYRWGELDRWWIEEKWGQKLLAVDAPTEWPKRLYLVLAGLEEARVKEVMEEYLPLEAPAPTFADRAGRWLAQKFPLE